MKKKIKVLHIVSALDNGGVERMLYNYIINIKSNDIQFDFVVHEKKEGHIEQIFKRMGSNIYHVTPKKESLFKNMKEINEIIRQEKYDVVHCHQNFSSFTTLWLAKKNKVKIRIVHSHGCNPAKGIIGKSKEKILRKINENNANYFFACGNEAAKWLYGENWKIDSHHIIMPNAIDINKFMYNSEIREKQRNQLGIKDEIVLLNVGRFSPEKNHMFLIDLMKNLNNKIYKLILVGEGTEKLKTEEKVKEMNLENQVIFLGNSNQVNEIMSMSDIFLLPSIHEGFPVTLLEAQANGIPCICSNHISKEVKLTNLLEFVTIQATKEWVEKLSNIKQRTFNTRTQYNEILRNSQYSIENQSKKYENWIRKIVKDGENK